MKMNILQQYNLWGKRTVSQRVTKLTYALRMSKDDRCREYATRLYRTRHIFQDDKMRICGEL